MSLRTSKIYFLFTITIRVEVQSVFFLCNMTTRNESFNHNFPFRKGNNWNVALNFGDNFAAVFTLTIANFTLIGYYFHYVNSSPLNWKTIPFRFWGNKTKTKQDSARVTWRYKYYYRVHRSNITSQDCLVSYSVYPWGYNRVLTNENRKDKVHIKLFDLSIPLFTVTLLFKIEPSMWPWCAFRSKYVGLFLPLTF